MALKVWLPLTGTLENKGISNIAISDNGPTIADNGKIGKCYYFDNKAITLTSPLVDNFAFSVCGWMKLDEGYQTNYGFHLFAIGNNFRCCLSKDNSLFRIVANGATQLGTVEAASTITTNTWYHIVVTYGDGTYKIYLNGVLNSQKTLSAPNIVNQNAVIGTYTTEKCKGWLNDFRLYDHCLSPLEVKEISQGLILHYKLDGFSGGVGDNILTGTATQTTLIANSSSTTTNATGKWGTASGGNGTYSIINIENDTPVSGVNWGFKITNNTSGNKDFCQHNQPYVNGVTYTVSWYMRGQGTYLVRQWNITDGKQMQSKTGAVNTTEWTYYTWTFTANEELETDSCSLHLGATGNSSSLEWCAMKMEIGTVATPWTPAPQDFGIDTTKIVDSSGYGNNGSILNTLTASSDTERYKVSTSFNGTDSGILIENLPLSNIINNAITYSFWIKPNGESSARSVYFGSYNSTSWSIEKTAGNLLRLYWNGSPDETCTNATIVDNIWQHICVVKNGTSDIKAYINGVQKWASTANHNTLNFPTTYRIGRDTRSNDGTPYKGLMSDFRIYATALSAEDIADLYHTPANIDNLGGIHGFEFQEISNNILTVNAFEQGGIQDANGQNSDGMNNRIRTFYIPVVPENEYRITVASDFHVRTIHYYNNTLTWISAKTVTPTTNVFTTPANCYYVRIAFQRTNANVALSINDINLINPTLTGIINKTELMLNDNYNINIQKNGVIKANNFSTSNKISNDKSGIIEATIFIEK